MESAQSKTLAEWLEKTRWANDFAWKELIELAAYIRLDQYKPGDVISEEGSKDLSLMIICQGKVQIIKHDVNQKPRLLTELAAGQTVGEIALVDGQPRSATVKAVDQVIALTLTRERFEQICDENPRLGIKVAMRLARLLSARLRATTGALSDYLH